MAKIKYDVSGVDHKKAAEAANFEQPTPGTYRCKVREMNPGFSKKDGKPDKTRPRIEVIFEVVDKKFKGARLWYYLTFGEGYPKEKFDQFLQAFGINTAKKSKGEFDTDRMVGKFCTVQVKKGTNQTGDYRAEVANVLPDQGENDDEDDDDVTDDDEDDDVTEEDEEESSDDEEDDEDDEEEEPDDEYDTMDVKALRAELKSRDLETKGAKPALIDRLRKDDAGGEDDEDDGPF